jgi:hypothetical protein
VRTIPGTDPNDIVRKFQLVIADSRIEVKLGQGGGLAASEPRDGRRRVAHARHTGLWHVPVSDRR